MPDGWEEVELQNILKYEQPYNYSIESTEYNKTGIPVLTAGKSFILGYTNEKEGIYNNLPVIIFDDFTTDSKFVDFPFKVKSSAMKFLQEKQNEKISLKLLYEIINQLKYSSLGGDHKRRWISEFSKKKVLLPKSLAEQTQIAKILSTVDKAIEQTGALIAKYEKIKTSLMQDLLTKGIDENGKIRSEETHEFKDSPLGMIPVEWEVVRFGDYIKLRHGYQFRNYDFTEFGIPVIKIGEISKDNKLVLENCTFIEKSRLGNFKNIVIANGDVLMALTGATLGKSCIVRNINGPLLQNYRVGCFEPNEEFIRIFLYYMLTYNKVINQVFNRTNEGAQGNIGKTDFENIWIYKPSRDEQLMICEKTEKISNYIEELKTEKQKCSSIKKGLMQDLLTGKVRVNKLIKNFNQTESRRD